jgi:putative heme transporter
VARGLNDGTAGPTGDHDATSVRDEPAHGADDAGSGLTGAAPRPTGGHDGGDERDPREKPTAPVVDGDRQSTRPGDGEDAGRADEEMPRVRLTRREVVASVLFVLLGVGFLYVVLPRLAGETAALRHLETWERGNSWWLAIGVLLEVLSFAGYVVLFRAVFVRGQGSIGWRESYQITLAGVAATRLFATAGAGGVALTAWALRRSGMEARLVACRMVAFMVLLYAIYMGSLIIDGVALRVGLFPGGGSFAITIIPAIAAAVVVAIVGAMALLPDDFERRLRRWASGSGRAAHWIASAAAVPALAASGVRTAIDLIRAREPGLLGAVAWWGFDICVLWAMFHAFGSAPPFTVIWMAYFVGTLGNLLPLPGGLGGVEGGMIGAFVAFGVDLNLAVLAVLSYRAISFWLPTLPGGIAYLQLRRTVARWREEQKAPSSPAGRGASARTTGALGVTQT